MAASEGEKRLNECLLLPRRHGKGAPAGPPGAPEANKDRGLVCPKKLRRGKGCWIEKYKKEQYP